MSVLDGSPLPGGRAPLDLRLAAPAVGLWLTVLALLGSSARTALLVAVAAGLLAAATLPLLRHPRGEAAAALLAAALVCAAGGALAVAGRGAAVAASPVTALAEAEQHTELSAVISSDPRPRANPSIPGRAEFVVDARTEWVAVDGGRRVRTRVPVVLLVHGEDWRHLVPSRSVRVRGRLVPADGGFGAALLLVRGPPREVGPPSAAHAWAGWVRARLRQACAALPRPERGLLPALVVGDTSELDAETAETFRTTGMTHLLTVSGANLAVMTGAALAAARWCRLPPWAATVSGAVTIAGFVLLARPEPSVLRAAFMGAIALVSLAAGRPRIGVATLAAAVIGLLLFDPGLAASYGFALSVLATGGILVLAPRWRDAWARRLPVWLAEAVAVTLAAQVSCAPLLVVLSTEVSWVSVPANVLAGLFVPVATVGGFAVAALGTVALPVARVAVWVPGTAVYWIRVVAEAGARVPHGALPWRSDALGALLLAVLLAALLVLRGRARRVVAAVTASAVVAATAVTCLAPPWPPSGWAVVACDVGQGDALALAAGRRGTAVVVDAGVAPRAVDRCLGGLRVRRVALLVLTHHDLDHAGGVRGVLRGRAVDGAAVPPGFDSPVAAEALAHAGVGRRTVHAGQRLAVGPWRLSVLWPPSDFAGDEPNEGSVVLLARLARSEGTAEPLSVLLTGDIEERAQRALLAEPALRGVDVLKTPHHGAATQEAAFLTATRPRVTLTSVGADNRYGHPSAVTWTLLTGLTPASYRTDRHGDIAVVPGPDGPSVHWRGPRPR
ncbi:ComEC/Rec2 family competence protein [Thermobifida halotolerans]|uniref:ComEC/Rec2 family competence protein n=1 Tax=Thermobifida halotolerans TaxID=483545 RepID=A0AA97M443_9ACTN|nr:ComEC/Rec2 family competence protein [Thermobifida halotolerans]UOE19919.1 ComEC/Rec2 family competence protein [Thermobifida halotolerans]